MKFKQHLIALDLDGTLLTDQKTISPRNRKIVKQAISDGHIVVISTGRSFRASAHYYHQLKLTTPMVNFNGALTHHPQSKNWGVFHHPIPLTTALQVIKTCNKLGVYNILAEIQNNTFLDQHDEEIINFFQNVSDNVTLSFTIGSIKNKLIEDPTSLLIKPKEEHVKQLSTYLDANHNNMVEHRNWGAPWNIFEITKKGIHKAFGLRKIAQYYQIPKERIIAFGDEDNDLEMIDYAGIGVAMDNAIHDLKSIAKYVTYSNEEDGVGDFLKQYLNIQLPVH